jgi:hypothetical protein
MKNAIAGLGLAPDAAMVTYPIELFLPGSDIGAIETRKREFYNGLTRWQPEQTRSTDGVAPLIAVEGASFEDALERANYLMITNLWGDGLPLWPATPARVERILRGSVLPRTHVIGKFPPRGGVTTVETCAIALAMAGGRPEYLPVLLAAVDAFLDPTTRADQLQAASGGAYPVVIVNGPIAKQIRLNATFGCLGPDPQRPAGASIGRALRLIQQNVGGALPGIGAMANYGGMRYTNMVFAEDEDNLPAGWDTHASDRHGFARGANSISLAFASGATNIRRRGAKKETPEEDTLQGMYRMADYMRVPNLSGLFGYHNGTPGMLLIPGVVAQTMAGLGWDKQRMREFFWEHSRIPMMDLKRAGGPAWVEIDADPVTRASLQFDPWPVTARPENFIIIVAGGGHPTNSYWLQGYSPAVIGRDIRVPKTFDQLLLEADRDLGCGSEACMI